jgi:hypothetical protein
VITVSARPVVIIYSTSIEMLKIGDNGLYSSDDEVRIGRRLRTVGPEGDDHPPSQPGPDGCVVETHVSAAVDGRYGDRRRARNSTI